MSDHNLETSWLWYKRLSHLNFKAINKLACNKLVNDLLDQVFDRDHICKSCQTGKQTSASFPSVTAQSSSRILELLHLDLFGAITLLSINGRKYTHVVIDEYSRFMFGVILCCFSYSFESVFLFILLIYVFSVYDLGVCETFVKLGDDERNRGGFE